MTTSSVVFLLVLLFAAAFFSYSAQRLVRYLRIGKNEFRLNEVPRRTWNLLAIGIAQRKILRDPVAGPMHALVFCFLVPGRCAQIIIQDCARFSYVGPSVGAPPLRPLRAHRRRGARGCLPAASPAGSEAARLQATTASGDAVLILSLIAD
jgi:hypothetical protein